jgi:hypothetical protein
MVIRPDANFRGFAGHVASGMIRPGDEVLALPSGRKTRLRSIVSYDGNLPEAFAPMSVTVQLEDEIDLSRGDMLVSPENGPRLSKRFQAMVVWLHGTPLEVGRTYIVKHTAKQTKIRALRICHRVNIHTLEPDHATQLNMNDIASVEFETHAPLFFDPYERNRATGSFILIDTISNATVGAGMIQEFPGDRQNQQGREITYLESANIVSAGERYKRHGHRPAVFLLPNQRGLATRLERALFDQGFEVLHLDAADAPPETLVEMIRVTKALGAISIYSCDAFDPGVMERLSIEATVALFDLSAEIENASEEEILRRALALADSLRIANSRNHQE